jgi:hypothetical protein
MTISEFKTILDSIDTTAYGKFIINFNNQWANKGYCITEHIHETNKEALLFSAFKWGAVPETDYYWYNINKEYLHKLKENNNDNIRI